MKPIQLILLFIFLGSSSFAQIKWVNDMQVAQSLAIEKDQLIVMDFWAVWCGPCKAMDKNMWNTKELAEISRNFIPFKVDVDNNRELAINYNANSIPKVVIITASGEVVWEKMGFSYAQGYIDVLKAIPSSLGGLNKIVINDPVKSEKGNHHYQTAMAYQNIGKSLSHITLKNKFLELSTSHFKKSIKYGSENDLQNMAELNIALNSAYAGAHNKAQKKLAKLAQSDIKDVQELRNFVEAFCYKCDGNQEMLADLKSKISNPAYVKELNDQ